MTVGGKLKFKDRMLRCSKASGAHMMLGCCTLQQQCIGVLAPVKPVDLSMHSCTQSKKAQRRVLIAQQMRCNAADNEAKPH
jgi:hypothetical protein